MLATLGKIAMAVIFGGLLCAFPASSVHAAYHRGGGHGGGAHYAGHGGGYHGGGHGHWGGWGGTYYAPGADYYVAPEPYVYGGAAPCYWSYGEYYCSPPPPPGMNLFFGL